MFRSEKAGEIARTLVTLSVLASCLFFAGSVFLARREGTKTSYLVISSRPKIQDTGFVEISKRFPQITYIRSEDPFGHNYMTYFVNHGHGKDVQNANLILVEASKATSPIVDPKEIRRVIESVHSEEFASDKLPFLIALCLGLGLGKLLSKLPFSLVGALAGLGVLTMVFKFATRCLTCWAPSALGLDLSLWAAFAFALICISDAKRETWVSFAVAGGSLAVQATLLCQYDGFCEPCLVAMLINACLFMCALPQLDADKVKALWPPKFLLVPAVAISSVLVFASNGTINEGFASRGSLANRVGQSIHQFGISIPLMPKGCIVVVGSDTCSACQDAKQSLAVVSSPPIIFIAAVSTGADTIHDTSEKLRYRGSIGPTPAIFVVNEQGVILRETHGWSRSQLFVSSFLTDSNRVLREGLIKPGAQKAAIGIKHK